MKIEFAFLFHELRAFRLKKVSKSTGKRPDFFLLKSKHDRIVVEAKWCIKAMKSHLDQILSYKGNPFYCQKGVLVYPSNVQLPRGFKELAKNRAVEVVKLPVEKMKRGIFKKKYLR